MNRKERNKAKKILRRNLIAGTLLLFLLGLSIAGATGAWFTSASTIQNLFTAGTVLIDAEVLSKSHSNKTDWNPEDCIEIKYKVENEGTKSIYARARFEGYWRYAFHRNTATVTAKFNDVEVTASDSAHYSYGSYDPEPDFVLDWNQSLISHGFTTKTHPLVTVFPELNLSTVMISSISNDHTIEGTTMAMQGDYDQPFGPIPLKNADFTSGGFGAPDPSCEWLVEEYGFPSDCDLMGVKIENPKTGNFEEQSNLTFGCGADGFNIEMTVNGNTLDFETDYIVYYVWLKAGPGGHLYGYPNGTLNETGLISPVPDDISHVTFYFCEPNPQIEIKKQVWVGGYVNGGKEWHDADLAPGPVIDPKIPPRFRFVVTNTGNVPLTDIEVYDDVFGTIGSIHTLVPGESVEYEIEDTGWQERQVSVAENVTVEVFEDCSDPANNGWKPQEQQELGTHFYYGNKVPRDGSINICVQVCLKEDVGSEFDGAVFTIYAYFDAVQSSNDIVEHHWPEGFWP